MKRTGVLIYLIVTVVSILLCGCKKGSVSDSATDAEHFKYEYESINGKYDENGMKSRILNIPDENPIVYATYSDILRYMDQKDSFAIYFGFAECPWCRSCLEAILESAADCGIYPVYYVDVQTSRDEFAIREGKTVKIQEGNDGYDSLLITLEDVLSDYILYDENGSEIKVGEKRIYAPNLIIVKDGIAIKMADDDGLITDPYEDITEQVYQNMKMVYTNAFSELQK